MDKRELARLFDTLYEGIKNTGLTYVNKGNEHVISIPHCRLSKAEKIVISKHLKWSKTQEQNNSENNRCKTAIGKYWTVSHPEADC